MLPIAGQPSLRLKSPQPGCLLLAPKTSAGHRSRAAAIECRERDGGPSNPSAAPRRLILMRHADAEETRAVRDHDRPVTPAGAAAAADVARQLASSGWVPQVLVCSNAARSRQTLDEMRRALPALGDADEHVLGSLYTTSQLDGQTRGHLAEIVAAEAEDGHACVLCLGHNKGWSEAASAFAGEVIELSNCDAALLEGRGGSWGEAFGEGAAWRLVRVLTPGGGAE